VRNGWQVKPLKALCDDVRQDVVDGPFGSELQRKDYITEGVPVLKIQNIKPFGIELKKMDYVSPAKSRELKRHSYRRGDIIMTKLGSPLGVSAIVEDLDEGVIVADLVRIRAQRVNTKYLCYHLNSQRTSDFINSMQKGTTRPRVTLSVVRELPIALPSLEEQHRIVGILDEAFEGIATAKSNAEKNLQNARALFESHLQSAFTQRGAEVESMTGGPTDGRSGSLEPQAAVSKHRHPRIDTSDNGDARVTRTGGRQATLRHIPGKFSLAVGMPDTQSRKGWRWSPLTDLARLESGHTPSRRHPEYWGGSIPWIGIQDARERHGRRIVDTLQKTNQSGISNSSARVLPKDTVCLSRTASVGYVVVMGRPMATSQDFVNWVCSNEIAPDFLKYVFLAEGRRGLLRFASGSVHQTIYFPEAKAFHICHPAISEQLLIVGQLDSLRDEAERLEVIYQRKLAALDELKKSVLHQAFTGNL
jgi:type I restriction enzyme S subunit